VWQTRQRNCPALTITLRRGSAEVAQLVEHRSEKPGVDSSILSLGTTILNTDRALEFYGFVVFENTPDTFARVRARPGSADIVSDPTSNA
jgi:hypothetical protein